MDPLSHLLSLYPVRTALDVRCHFGAPWVLNHAGTPRGVAPYHLIVRGEAQADGLMLQTGDIIVFPHGGAHQLHIGDTAHATPSHSAPGLLRLETNEGDGPQTDILCGEFHFDADGSAGLLAALPEVLVVRTSGRPDAQSLRYLLRMLQEEAETPRGGSEAVIRQLASALFTLLIRTWLEQTLAVPGLFGVLAERRLQAAMNGMLTAPEKPWTLEDLADTSHMSRATFARLFKQAANATPAEVLTQLRMARAARLLDDGRQAGDVAEAVGYQSEAAFNRAFKRLYGVGPGAYKRHARHSG
ncbi:MULTISPECIES: AraC family transcriptional regulator [unclassified Duganella]|jgi:AraC family transcriptional activator of mtrCDE|uniref:AraC family transcriptional regulator n=1 Tax=unclassified Duganella TaxID=2636909 RepID=UPI000888A05E|nr:MULTISPECIES: AraC family transcriptional regulator [unclassified Duganella]SDG94119.1 AraC family transcriptional regulator, activator of mtrCDE [Duganella sp. OV458]SDJ48257.1 AraC family transcriptional regulator, activator of mtrCDE [Duganella sp. OV510]